MGSPPEALFEACAQLEQNAMCQAELNGQMIDGTCGIPPFDTRLMCIPSNLGMNGGGVPPNGMNGGGLAGATDLIGGEPDYFEVDVHYQDKVWPKVAMRFKGNSSLAMTWQQGLRKIGFRLHFDHFEDKYPQIKNQRFFGFQELSLSAGASDDSLMRDALASYLLSAFDLPVAKASPYQITRIDENGHEIYWGLYTVLEDISDQFTQRYYGENRGNLYKPEGNSANWVGFDEAGFEKKNNASDADWSDIQTAIEALHADRSNLATWQENLEKIFNVDGFIKWLAVNQCIENWDVYGAIAHNYYLYGLSSKNGQLQWIPWDHNEAFKTGKMNIGQFDLLDVGENWPLIQILMSIPSYQAQFYDDVEAFLNGPYHQDQLFPWIDQYHALIAQAAHLEMAPYSLLSSETAFDDSLEGSTDSIKNHIIQRQTIAKSALDSYRNAQSNNMDSMNNP
jgi:hypothetical protein